MDTVASGQNPDAEQLPQAACSHAPADCPEHVWQGCRDAGSAEVGETLERCPRCGETRTRWYGRVH